MNAMGILLVLVGIWVFINAINGNLPGLVNGTVQFNTGSFTNPTTPAGNTGLQQQSGPGPSGSMLINPGGVGAPISVVPTGNPSG